MDELKLILPTAEYAGQIAAYRQEFLEAGSSMDGTGLLREIADPLRWLERVTLETDPATVPAGRVPSTQFLTLRVADNTLVGTVQARHCFNDFLAEYGGHIGYSIRPGERRKGYAGEQLRQALAYCREALGMERVLITCLTTNEGSRRTILKNGGVYERTTRRPDQDGEVERYWIQL